MPLVQPRVRPPTFSAKQCLAGIMDSSLKPLRMVLELELQSLDNLPGPFQSPLSFLCVSTFYSPALAFSFNRVSDPLPAVMSQYWAARATIASLRVEQEELKRKINSLTSHRILHDDYCEFFSFSQTHASEQAKGAHEDLSLSNNKYLDLVIAHCNSLCGEYAENYYGLFLEYSVLQKQYRSVVASNVVTRYRAQRLVVKAGRLYYPPSVLVLGFALQPNPANLFLSGSIYFPNSCPPSSTPTSGPNRCARH